MRRSSMVLTGTWGCIVDKEWCIAQGDWDGTQASYEELNNPEANATPLNDETNGTGPYKLDRWDKGVEIVLDAERRLLGQEGQHQDLRHQERGGVDHPQATAPER